MIGISEHLRVRALLSTVAVLAAVVGVVLFQATIGGVLLVAGIFSLPLAAYVTAVRTRAGSIVGGAGLVALAVFTQLYVSAAWERGSSTAPLGYLGLPIYGLLLVGATYAIEGIVYGLKQRDLREH